MIGLRPPHLLVAAFLLFYGPVAAFGEDASFQEAFFKEVLTPWITAHYSPYLNFKGPDAGDKSSFSWSFQSNEEPKEGSYSQLNVDLDVCSSSGSASKALSREVQTYKDAGLPSPLPLKLGDEAFVYNYEKEPSEFGGKGTGGWIQCRVGSYLVTVSSDAVALKVQEAFITLIADKLASQPQRENTNSDNREKASRREMPTSFTRSARCANITNLWRLRPLKPPANSSTGIIRNISRKWGSMETMG